MDDDDYSNERIQVLILSPARELAHASNRFTGSSAAYMDSIYHQTIFGGIAKYHDINLLLDRLLNILVATLGRLCDVLNRKKRSVH
jgi:superfamily II DNA/RNA helicase